MNKNVVQKYWKAFETLHLQWPFEYIWVEDSTGYDTEKLDYLHNEQHFFLLP